MNESIFQEVFVNLEKTNSPDFLEKGKKYNRTIYPQAKLKENISLSGWASFKFWSTKSAEKRA